jgi:hypothetical protein
MPLCPGVKNEENRAAFNALLTRLGGKPLSETDRLNKEDYLASLTKPQAKAYYAAHALLDMHTGSYENISAHLDAQERIKSKLQSRAGERGAVSPALLGSQQAADALKNAADTIRSAHDDMRRVFNPGARGGISRPTALMVRQRAAEMQRSIDQVERATRDLRKAFSRMQPQDRWDFIDAEERGNPQANAELDAAAQLFREVMDDDRDQVRALGTGKLETFNDTYMPRYWEKKKTPSGPSLAGRTKAPLEGRKAFLKRRSYEYFQDGLDAGETPLSDNPVDFLLWKHAEMQKYIKAHENLNELKTFGMAAFHRSPGVAPEGWVTPDDNLFAVWGRSEAGEMVMRGHYYMPEEGAKIFNNYLSRGLGDKKWFRSYRGISNVLNQFQLGISFFHGGFVSLDAVISNNALALYQATRGNIGTAIKTAVQSPLAPLVYLQLGRKMRQEWNHPGSHPELAPIVDAWTAGGGRANIDKFYQTNTTRKMMDAFRSGTLPGLIGGALRIPFAAVEQAARPLMEWYVPNIKSGAIGKMAEYELERIRKRIARGEDVGLDEEREAMAKVVDSVDNRMGQMIYDNLFWNKMAKDLGMASIRSLGWNLGDLREFGGGAVDILTQAGRGGAMVIRGGMRIGGAGPPSGGGGGGGGTGTAGPGGSGAGRIWSIKNPEVTHRMAYMIALPVTVGILGGITTWIMTGNKPDELRDYFYPKTGNLDEHGDPERVNLPSYMKDILPFFLARTMNQRLKVGGQMAINKLHPMLHMIGEMLRNKDYYGTEIRHADDPLIQQAKDTAKYIGKEFVPFGIRGVSRERERGATWQKALLSEIGITPAPRYVNQTAAQQLMADIQERNRPRGTRTKEQAQLYQMESEISRGLRKGGDRAEEASRKLIDAVHSGLLTKKQAQGLTDRSTQPQGLSGFKSMGVVDALDVYKLGTPAEKQIWRKALEEKEPLIESLPAGQRDAVQGRWEKAIGDAGERGVSEKIKLLRESDVFQSLDAGEKREILRDAIQEAKKHPNMSPEAIARYGRDKAKEAAAIERLKDSPAYKSKTPETQKRMLREEQARWRQPSAP